MPDEERKDSRPSSRREFLKIFLFAVLTIAAVAAAYWFMHRPAQGPLSGIEPQSGFEIHFLDVGQGDSALVICDGRAMLIDGGNVGDSSFLYSYLKKHNISELEYIVCTHPHEDHVGGLPGALNAAKVKKVFCSQKEYDSEPFADFLKYLDKQGVRITVPDAGKKFRLGSATCRVLGTKGAVHENMNDDSIVLKISYGECSFLFTGDAEAIKETELLESGQDLSSTVLKVGHHGSITSSSEAFLAAVSPQYAVISVGENQYGHPDKEVLARLEACGAEIYRTDECGTIVMKCDGKGLAITTDK